MRFGSFYRLVVTQATILRRNTSFWLASVVVAVVSITVFGWLFNPGSARPFRLGLVDEDGTVTSGQLRDAFEGVETVEIMDGDLDSELSALKDGERGAVVVIPAGFEGDLPAGNAVLESHLNVSDDPARTAYVRQTVAGVLSGFDRSLGAQNAFELREESVSTKNFRYIDFLIPGMIGMAIMYLNLGVGFLLVSWRQQGILRRLGVTPLPPLKLIGSQAASFALLSLVQVAIILGIGRFAFDVRVEGSFGALAVTLALGIAAMLSIGYTLGSVLNTPTAVSAFVNLVAFPMLFLGGSYFPLDTPTWMEPIVEVIPLTHLNDALREVVNRGGDVSALWADWTWLLAWAVAGFGTAVRLFRWQ